MGGAAGNHNTDNTEQPGRKQEPSHSARHHIPCAPSTEGPAPIPDSFAGKRGRKSLCRMPLGPEEFTARIKTKFSPVPGLSAFLGGWRLVVLF